MQQPTSDFTTFEATVSQSALEAVLQDIRTGAGADYVQRFKAARPDWGWQEDEVEEGEGQQARNGRCL